jgi:hypothetical protein
MCAILISLSFTLKYVGYLGFGEKGEEKWNKNETKSRFLRVNIKIETENDSWKIICNLIKLYLLTERDH